MSITVEQLRHAIEDDQTEYGDEFNRTRGVAWSDTHTYTVAPVNGAGWDEAAHSSFNVVIDGELLEAAMVDQTGGMDEGSNASSTWKIGDQYFRKSGYYASHYGYDWDGELEEVHPVQKVVTVFE